MNKDLYSFKEDTIKFSAQLLDKDGTPVNLDDYSISMRIANEYGLEMIEELSVGNGIRVKDADNAMIEVSVTPSLSRGYIGDRFVYQLMVINDAGESFSYLSGRIFAERNILKE